MKKIIQLLLITALFMTGCASSPTTSSYTIKDMLDRDVTFEHVPTRIVSPYYISTSMVIALDLETQLVGIENDPGRRPIYQLAAPELLDLPNIGTLKDFDLEAAAALNPDLVILPLKLKDMIEPLKQLGIPTIVINPESQELLNQSLKVIGEATKHEENCEELITYIQTRLDDLKQSIPTDVHPTVYLGGNSSLLSTAGANMYQNTLIENAGGINVAKEIEDSYWAEISYEQLLTWDPDFIILASAATYSVEDVLNDPILSSLRAIKNHHVYKIPGEIEALDSPLPGSFLGSFYIASVLFEQNNYEGAKDAFYERFY